MSRRAAAVVAVVVVFLAALSLSARRNPVYQSRALVALGVVTPTGPGSLEQQLTVAQGSAARMVAQARYGAAANVHVGVVDGGALEFRARSRHPAHAAEVANAYAQAYVDLRRAQLLEDDVGFQGPESSRLRDVPLDRGMPSVVVPARPARSPMPPWPSETWTLAGMVLIALALAVPDRRSSP
jgi:hypothetical protein